MIRPACIALALFAAVGCASSSEEGGASTEDAELTDFREWTIEQAGARISPEERRACDEEGRLNCYRYLRAGNDAQDAALIFFRDGANAGRQDAFKHTYWNALMAKKMGEASAKKFGDAHENGYPSNFSTPHRKLQTEMDFFNNDVGRKIGAAHPDASEAEIQTLVKEALASGQLRAVQYGPSMPDGILVETSICKAGIDDTTPGKVRCGG